MMQRIIFHIDLDAFYASVEELRRPEIVGKAVVVCVYSGRSEDSGAVATSNYLARTLGIKAGMPIVFAKRLAKDKDVVFLPVDKEYYTIVSDRVMDLFEGFCDVMEQASIDEAYLEVTNKTGGDWEKAERLAKEIKSSLLKEENLTCSVGIGPNKFVAKMASKKQKPDGLTVVKEDEVIYFLWDLPAAKLHGVGEKTEEQLDELGIKTSAELADFEFGKLEHALGRNKAILLQNKARGIDYSPVQPRIKQQISNMASLKQDSSDAKEIAEKIIDVASEVGRRIKKMGASFRTVSVILIDSHLRMQTRSKTIDEEKEIEKAFPVIKSLTEKFLEENPEKAIRRIGVGVSNLNYGVKKSEKQKTLFDY
jgi:DNA polymerase IV (archaeal DinB-like DNA polymerase)